MDDIRWERRPDLDAPVMVAAFDGWNDAGDAATLAAAHLCDAWGLERIADIDPDGYFDFTARRPQIHLEAGEHRRISWPRNDFHAGTIPGGPDIVVLTGTEPALRWRRFSDQIIGMARGLDVRMVVTLGALLADVTHTLPTHVIGTANTAAVRDRLDLDVSSYEGATGIVGVLHDGCERVGLESCSFWAAVPTYVPSAPSPKAARALVRRVEELLGVVSDCTDLDAAAQSYEHHISQLVADDEDLSAYVAALEEEAAAETERIDALPSGEELIADIERFLRDED